MYALVDGLSFIYRNFSKFKSIMYVNDVNKKENVD